MRFIPTEIPEVQIIEPAVYTDSRGYFTEAFHQEKFRLGGVEFNPVQLNRSRSIRGVLRGLHCQIRTVQAKLIGVSQGEIFDVGVDLREDSPTFGRWIGSILSGDNFRQLYLPQGFAHGYVVLSDYADVVLQTSWAYSPGDEFGIAWDDPDIGVEWPTKDPILSQRDLHLPRLSEISRDLFSFTVSHRLLDLPRLRSRGCFISYARGDSEFAGRLYRDLMAAQIPCWWAPEDMKPGDRLREAFQAAIEEHDDFLLILSKSSIRSDWVHSEVELALERERESGGNIIKPISVDSEVFETEIAWAAHLRRTRHIADFSGWTSEKHYEVALRKLVATLKEGTRRAGFAA